MKYALLILSAIAIPTVLIYLWLEYGVREYCLGCGKLAKGHDIENCSTNTTSNKLAISFGLTLGAWMFLVSLLSFLWML